VDVLPKMSARKCSRAVCCDWPCIWD
jgi:hypothetical protein